jgi:hypothetical protein
MKRHPLSALFSRCDLQGEDLRNLADDIKTNGQLLPITIHEGMVLDGWNRFQACRMAEVEPVTMPLGHGIDPWEFVKSSNMLRRHMSPAERVAIFQLKRQMDGEFSKLRIPTEHEIAKDLEVSAGTAHKAAVIAKAQDPVLNEALADKRISLDQAADLAKLPEPERKAALENPEPKAPKVKDAPSGCPSCKALREELDELISESRSQNEEFQAMIRICDADDKLAQLRVELERMAGQNRLLNERLAAKMTECHALAADAKRWMNKFLKLEKKLNALDKDGTFEKGA